MESAAVLRSFQCITSPLKSAYEKPGVVPMNNASVSSFGKFSVLGSGYSWLLPSSQNKFEGLTVSCMKASDATVAAKSDGKSNGAVMSDSCQNGSVEKKQLQRAKFPNGFMELVTEVCDGTEIAELKLKVGDFEMHMKRNIEAPVAPPLIQSPTIAPPIPSEPMSNSAPAATPPIPSAGKVSPFTNINAEKSAKIAALEASGASGYVLVSSPAVGSFRRGMIIKGNRRPPIMKEGDVIKEGQTIGFLDQFGADNELPVKSDVAGEVLKILYNDGEAVGYGDPLIAVLPSFHGIS